MMAPLPGGSIGPHGRIPFTWAALAVMFAVACLLVLVAVLRSASKSTPDEDREDVRFEDWLYDWGMNRSERTGKEVDR